MAKKTNHASQGSTPKGKRRAATPKRPPEWTFPRNCLEESIRVAQAIEDKHAGNPMEAVLLSKAVGFRKASDWRFRQLLRSANIYGLVSGSGKQATVALEPVGQDIVAPSSPDLRQRALVKAFRNVQEFQDVADFYKGKSIPEDEFFSNTLARKFNIPRDRIKQFIEVFLKDIQYIKGFDANVAEVPKTEDEAQADEPTPSPATVTVSDESTGQTHIRQFLDTCFVMMPFGAWFDRYYKDIYIQAIREAGFEAVRADELFNTGTIIEQIWEQIKKSKLLLADLSEKNANVFYELGLAHAAGKPVILTAANVDDVPFDLRHLRTIIYEVREPDWGDKLRKAITAYLRNAKSEPEKSIPQPFRDEFVVEGTAEDDAEEED